MDLKERFEHFDFVDTFSRVDSAHLLDIYIGIDQDAKKTLFILSDTEPPIVESTKFIDVRMGKRKDGRWGLSFTIADNQYVDIFLHFCNDIIESSRILTAKYKCCDFICERYLKWQEMLTRSNDGLLSPSEIKGLVGELFFLKERLIPDLGETTAIASWIGPKNAAQDFVFSNTWYEVKSTVSGAENVSISSIEQLDTTSEGELVVIFLDTTSNTDINKITLNQLYNDICESLASVRMKIAFSTIMLSHGYFPRSEYDDYPYRFSKLSRYIVNTAFPCLRRQNLSSAVIGAKYVLSLAAIKAFERE